jgi:hypothetical protein
LTDNTPTPEIQKPRTLEDVERYLAEKEMAWQKRRQTCYEEFIGLIVKARALTQDPAVLAVIDEFEELQCKMANTDTIRFIGNGFRHEAVKREYGDAPGISEKPTD